MNLQQNSALIPVKCALKKCGFKWKIPSEYTGNKLSSALKCPCGGNGKIEEKKVLPFAAQKPPKNPSQKNILFKIK
jgi:hypothetical protein